MNPLRGIRKRGARFAVNARCRPAKAQLLFYFVDIYFAFLSNAFACSLAAVRRSGCFSGRVKIAKKSIAVIQSPRRRFIASLSRLAASLRRSPF
jgi:hypothetical protein